MLARTEKGRLSAVSLLVSACDDVTVITHLDATARLTKSRITANAPGGFPTAVHGAPFPRIEAFQVAEVLTLPPRWPRDIAFRAVEPGETGGLVERLMGKKPELRFQYITENARFAADLDV